MAKCDICGKGPQFGNNVPHSKHTTRRRWNVNVQKTIVMVDGRPKRMNVCTRCLRTLSKTA